MTRTLLCLALLTTSLGACRTVQPEPEPVFIPPPVVKTCFYREELVIEVVPEETKTFTAITEIPNPPYEPIQRREQQTRVVRPAYTVFKDTSGNVVSDDKICDDDLVTQPVL